MRRFALGIGTNLGDRLDHLRQAVAQLRASPDLEVEAVSRVYETPPWGPPQPHYLNAAVRISTALTPAEVLARCLSIEAFLGRVQLERWGPRIIDLDVLYAEEDGVSLAVDEPTLRVPHPRLEERSFALAPLLDVMPHLDATFGARLRALGALEALVENLET